jgi:mevalonate kinase
MSESFTFSAPGNLMLLGEHAVLHGRLAVVCAVDRRVRATLLPRTDGLIRITSALGEHHTDIETLAPHPKLKFAMAAVAAYRGRLKSGFDLQYASEFSHTIGFGSSAAITVVTHAALRAWLGEPDDLRELFLSARQTIRDVQGMGSGADVAASVFGGVVGYRAEPIEIHPVPVSFPLTAVYSGSKLPTPEVISIVEARRAKEPQRFAEIFMQMEQTSFAALAALRAGDWKLFGSLLNAGQGLMEAIGVSNEKLDAIVAELRADPAVYGGKISGSGLGDCAVGWGRARNDIRSGEPIPVNVEAAGVRRETTG